MSLTNRAKAFLEYFLEALDRQSDRAVKADLEDFDQAESFRLWRDLEGAVVLVVETLLPDYEDAKKMLANIDRWEEQDRQWFAKMREKRKQQ